MTKVAVWSNKYHDGWDGDFLVFPTLKTHPVVDLSVALSASYDSDAHFTPGVATSQGVPLDNQVRFNIGSERALASVGIELLFYAAVIDVDNKKGNTDEWFNEQLSNLHDSPFRNAWWYRTKGGYRLVWTLPSPLNTTAYIELMRKLFYTLSQIGIRADILKDWGRAYRLPFVVRDGIKQTLPYDFSSDNVLDIDSLITPSGDSSDPVLAAVTANKSTPIRIVKPGEGQHQMLFSAVAGRMRNTSWITEDMYEGVLELYNQTYCDPPVDHKAVAEIARNIQKYEQKDNTTYAGSTESGNAPVERIQVRNGGLHEAMNFSMNVLAANPGILYNRDSMLVWINRGTDDSAPRIEVIPKPALRGILEQLVTYYRIRLDKTGNPHEETVDCPKDLVDILDCQNVYPGVQQLEELLLCPTIDASGNIIHAEGYYPDLKAMLLPSKDVAHVELNHSPSRLEAVRALGQINELLADFPFANDAHRSVALSSIITPVVRTAITGPVPMILIDSPTPGTGKSLLVDIGSIIATGAPASRMVWTREEEVEKRITALLSGGARNILIDNADSKIGGASLDAVLTSNYWMGRVLSKSEMVRVKAVAQWTATGNNLQVSGDMARRSLKAYLDPGIENPETRTDFKIHNILDHVKKNRAKYVSAAITVVKAYMDCDEKIKNLRPLGSFESWSDTVRSALIWLGCADPVDSQAEIKTNDVAKIWGSVLEAMAAIWGVNNLFTAKAVYEDAFNNIRTGGSKAAHDALTSALEELIGGLPQSQKSVAYLLGRWKDRVIGDYRLVRSAERHRLLGFQFRVENINAKIAAATA